MKWNPGRRVSVLPSVLLLLICLIMPAWADDDGGMAPCDPDPPRRWFLALGQMNVDHGNLNDALKAANYGQFDNQSFAVGFLGYTRPRGRWILGGSVGLSCQSVAGPSRSRLEAYVCSTPWSAQLGYVVVDHPTLTVFPYAGLGLMFQSLNVVRDAAVDFEDQLNHPIGEAEFDSRIYTLSFGVHLDNLIVLKVSEQRASGLALGFRAEYRHGLSDDYWGSWQRPVNGAPTVTADSWSIDFLLGWGSQHEPTEE